MRLFDEVPGDHDMMIAACITFTLFAQAQVAPQPAQAAPPMPTPPQAPVPASPTPASPTPASPIPAPPGMVWVPAGEFTMGTNDPRTSATNHPAHTVQVSGFFIDATEVTNAQFRAFVDATGYRTMSERPVDWEELKKQVPPGTPKPPDEMLKAGSLVFNVPARRVGTGDISQWWTWVTGANWQHPEGPQSSLEGRENHPVTHVSWDDAVAYCKWAGKRLPTEAEWERAARAGQEGRTYVWGDEPPSDDPQTRARCNIWQGEFPNKNTLVDGYLRTSPVKSFEPNAIGIYDTAGNVWEWCADFYRADQYERAVADAAGKPIVDPKGPAQAWDPQEAIATSPKHTIRGGSFLCHSTYCDAYRPTSRRGQSPDTGMSHLGFRCAMSPTPGRPASGSASEAAPAGATPPPRE